MTLLIMCDLISLKLVLPCQKYQLTFFEGKGTVYQFVSTSEEERMYNDNVRNGTRRNDTSTEIRLTYMYMYMYM